MFKKSSTGTAVDKAIAVEMLRTNVMIADEKLTITYINPSLRDLLQRAEAEIRRELPAFNMKTLIGSNIDIFHKNPSYQRNMLATLDRQHSATIRVGQQVFDLVVSPLKQGGKRIGFAVEWADAKERLLNEDYTGQILAIGRSQAVIQFTTDGTITDANDNFLNTMGYSLSEIKGKHHSMFVEPAVRDSSEYARMWDSLRKGQYVADQFKRVGKGGKQVFIQGSYNPIIDGSGKVIKVVKFATDVTQNIHAVNEIGNALDQLASGNLQQRLDQPFTPDLDKLRIDLNRAVGTLQTTMQQVNQSADTIRSGVTEIANAADNLSRRTEQQAANLEETAAALDEITETVKKSAQGATHAREVVEAADADAKQSAGVVRRAVEAMDMISASARQINQIIGVIDEIAFQTNLLALNAGVEAARAGDAGRGFAVVASEVRALAQRSAEAAKEIKNLISTSTTQVDSGVKLVTDAGTSLERIMSQVAEINTIVTRIAAGAQEQATGLMQVNAAINQMDQMTQQNATMVEESTAATHALSQETTQLGEMVSQFQVGHMADAPRRETRRSIPVHAPSPRAGAHEPAAKQPRTYAAALSD